MPGPTTFELSNESTNVNAGPIKGPGEGLEPPAEWRTIPVLFKGDGQVYFGIWAVNLLLILVTLGIYYPWAKYRRLKYFHQHTFVDGHAFDFMAQPKQMLQGYMLGLVVFGVYTLSSQASPLLGLAVLAR